MEKMAQKLASDGARKGVSRLTKNPLGLWCMSKWQLAAHSTTERLVWEYQTRQVIWLKPSEADKRRFNISKNGTPTVKSPRSTTPRGSKSDANKKPEYKCDAEGYLEFSKGLIMKDRFEIVKQIGRGTFSRVMAAKDVQANKMVAVKVIRNIRKYQAAARIEYQVLRRIKEKDPKDVSGCIHLHNHFQYNGHPCFVFELHGRSLYQFLSENKFTPFTLRQVQHISAQVVRAVEFMHKYGIVITDLKPENIVFEAERTIKRDKGHGVMVEVPQDTRIKVIDFGSAVPDRKSHSFLIQTRHYRAPEVVCGMRWSYPVDVWSLGCIILELMYGRMVFNTHDSIDHLSQMMNMIGPMSSEFYASIPTEKRGEYFHSDGRLRLESAKRSPVQAKTIAAYVPKNTHPQEARSLRDLVSSMLMWEPSKRVKSSEAMRHQYFKDLPTATF